MAILNKLLGLAVVIVLVLTSIHTNCHASSPLSMEIKQVEIAKDVADLLGRSYGDGGSGIEMYGIISTPRIRVLLELKNNSMDSVWFYGAKVSDKFTITYEYKGKQYSQEMAIIPAFHRNSFIYKIPPGETEEISVKFIPELLEDDEHPLNSSGYAQMLWEILPSIKVTYTRWERTRGYGQSDPISASWGDQEDIAIIKVPKGYRETERETITREFLDRERERERVKKIREKEESSL